MKLVARPKYKALYEEARRRLVETEGRLATLRGHVNTLAPVGGRVAQRLAEAEQASTTGAGWPYFHILPPDEWLTFAVFCESITRYDGAHPYPALEQHGFGKLTFQGKPVVRQDG